MRLIKAVGSRKMRDFEISAPEPESDREGIAVVALVRNVAPYLNEWIRFHQLAGVKHFFIFYNLSTDNTGEKLKEHEARGAVTSFIWNLTGSDADTRRRVSAQVTAYAHAVTAFGAKYRWFAFIDIDEFLVPKGYQTLMEAIEAAGSPSCMSLPWHMFGHSGHKKPPEGGVVRNFTERASLPYRKPDLLLRHKCIADPTKITRINIHLVYTSDMQLTTSNAVGAVISQLNRKEPGFFTSEGIQLNHYYCLSEEEMWEKINRGAANFASADEYKKRVLSKVAEMESLTEADDCAVRFLDSRLEAVAQI